MRNLLEEAELADQLGLDVFGVGEHHRPDYLVSSPAVVARRDRRADRADPPHQRGHGAQLRRSGARLPGVRHVDLISGGRAEIMAGRGSFIESFPLFGYDLDDYDELFAEKLELLLAIRDERARHLVGPPPRAAATTPVVWPRPVQDPLPVWIAVGGTPESVVRAGALGLPLTIAIIGGQPDRFVPLVELYRAGVGRAPATTRRARARDQHARVRRRTPTTPTARSRPPTCEVMNRIGRERGWPPSGATRVRGAAVTARARWPSARPSRSRRRSSTSTSCSATSATSRT